MAILSDHVAAERVADVDERPEGLRAPTDVERLTETLTLRGGGAVRVRAIRADDTERLRAFHAGLSMDTIVFRFFRVLPTLSQEMAERLTHIDYENRMALVATVGEGEDERIIAVVRYERTGPDVGEVAFVVADQWQGRGIATALLHRLADYARGRGFRSLVAITMGSNAKMMSMLRHCGFPTSSRYVTGEVEIQLDITQEPAPPFAA